MVVMEVTSVQTFRAGVCMPTKPKEYTFLVKTQADQPQKTVGGSEKALTNAHIARQGHRKRREQSGAQVATLIHRDVVNRGDECAAYLCDSDTVQRDGTADDAWELTHFILPTTSVLHRGSSDPFGATFIPVTADVHECLVFERDYFLPALHGKEVAVIGTTSHMSAFWQDTVAGLQDKYTGYAYLARSAAVMQAITFDPNISKLHLWFKAQAIAALREKMTLQRYNLDRLAVCWAIYALFTAEIAAHNFPAAQIHGAFLKHILQPDHDSFVSTDSRFRHAILYFDMQRASVSLTRSSFDLPRWLEEFLPGTLMAEMALDVAFLPATLDRSVSSEILRELLIGCKEHFAIVELVKTQPQLLNAERIANCSMRLLVFEGQLINLYVDMLETMEYAKHRSSVEDHYTAVAALAALAWLRRMGNHENPAIGSKCLKTSNVYNAGPVVIEKMECLLRAIDETTHASIHGRRWRLKLWCFYVGAIVEQNMAWINPLIGYHNCGFVRLARNYGLRTWEDIQHVLEGFLYFEGVGPTAEVWYEWLSDSEDTSMRDRDAHDSDRHEPLRNETSPSTVSGPVSSKCRL